MKSSFLLSLPFITLSAHVWRFTGYHDRNYAGASVTASGPGNPGFACHSVGALNNAISSFHWYNDGGCTLELYKGIDWTNVLFDRFSGNRSDPDLAHTNYNDDISSYGTVCT
ncbi:hypothetical protein AX16_010549 [Volvariella volvacea WC 439]|nr:hypothetical protein AX16_010549 [Volvariella volvacea WC 439]